MEIDYFRTSTPTEENSKPSVKFRCVSESTPTVTGRIGWGEPVKPSFEMSTGLLDGEAHKLTIYFSNNKALTKFMQFGCVSVVEWDLVDVLTKQQVEQIKAMPLRLRSDQQWQYQEKELLAFFNQNPVLQSLLYDLNLTPEQITDPNRKLEMLNIIAHFKWQSEGKPFKWSR